MKKTVYLVAIAFTFTFSSCQQRGNTPLSGERYTFEDSVCVVDSVCEIDSEDEAGSNETDGGNTSEKSNNYGSASISQECFAARDGYFDDLNKYCNRKDEEAIREGIATGRFTVLQPSSCTVVDKGFGKKKVRVNGSEWWVSSEFVSE